jgi:hypothetical protein
MIVAGIDNGLDGAVVVLDEDGNVIARYVMPTLGLTATKREFDGQMLRSYLVDPNRPAITHAFIEYSQAMPDQGGVSMWKTGMGYGLNVGLLVGLQIPYTVVRPLTWTRLMFAGLPKDGKNTTRIVAQRLWPKVDWRANERCRVAHDGLCDAALIAEFGRRTLKGQANAGRTSSAGSKPTSNAGGSGSGV